MGQEDVGSEYEAQGTGELLRSFLTVIFCHFPGIPSALLILAVRLILPRSALSLPGWQI